MGERGLTRKFTELPALCQGTPLAAQPQRMGSAPGSVDTTNIVAVCRAKGKLDYALLREMLGYFVDENHRRVAASQQALVTGDRELLRQIAHAMRGSAALVGAGHLHDLAWSLEMDAATSDLQLLGREVNKIRVELDGVIAALRRAHPEAFAD